MKINLKKLKKIYLLNIFQNQTIYQLKIQIQKQ